MRKTQGTGPGERHVGTTLLLVRHGATAANLATPYKLQGSKPDWELAPDGLDQAAAAAEALSSQDVVQVYCSPLKRARQTANAIAEKLGAALVLVDGLIEADVGLWAGLTWAEIEARWPTECRLFREDAERHGYLRGENYAQVLERTRPVVEQLVRRHLGETLAVVGHGVVNRVLLAHWLGLPLHAARRLPQDNAGISRVDFQNGRATVVRVNATDHLNRVVA